jgi:hypothetical protein
MSTEIIDLDALRERYKSTLADRRRRWLSLDVWQEKRWLTYLSGGLFTCFLHALLFSTWLLGSAGRKPHAPMTEGNAANAASASAGEQVLQLFFINEHGLSTEQPDESEDVIYQPPTPVAQMPQLTVSASNATPGAPSVSEGKDDDSPSNEATGDEAGRALMFGRYMNQIKARIDRAWVYPTASAQVTPFRCKVRIKQSKQGDVQEVMLETCGADMAWQQSLVTAIQQASPLSAPPDESVFSSVVTLTFEPELSMTAPL